MRPIRTVVRYLGGWSILVFFVVLLTFIFSFLGTIFCSVLAGMMVAATKLPRWHTCALSLVFPGVLFSMLRSEKAELLGRQVLMLSLVCFGAYWLTFVLASLLVFYEAKVPAGTAKSPGRKGSGLDSAVSAGNRARSAAPAETALAGRAATPSAPFNLEALQGKWAYAGAGANGSGQHRTLEIVREVVRLSAADSQGRILFSAEAQVQVCPSTALPIVRLSPVPPSTPADTLVSI